MPEGTEYLRVAEEVDNINVNYEEYSASQKKIKPPDDFEDEQDFLAHMRKEWVADVDADQENIKESLEDAEFYAGAQWDEKVKSKREGEDKPIITINRLPAFVAQVIGNRRLNETVIKILPDTGGDKQTAKIREGLIRNIQKVSRADVAYNYASTNQIVGGLGNFGYCE